MRQETLFLILLLHDSMSRVLPDAESDSIQCLMSTKEGERVYKGHIISYDEGYSYTNGDPPKHSHKMPEAPRDFTIDINENGTSIIWFLSGTLYGLKYLKHFIIRIEQSYTDTVTGAPYMDTDYIKIDLTTAISRHQITTFVCNYSRIKQTTFMIEGTMWALGKITTTADGTVKTDVDEYSKTKTVRRRIDPEYLKNLQLAEMCICSSSISIGTELSNDTHSSVSASIKLSNISHDTRVEIELINHTRHGDYIIQSWMTKGADFQGGKQFRTKVRSGSSYYLRVIRHCITGYVVSCGKTRAETMKSEALTIPHNTMNHGGIKGPHNTMKSVETTLPHNKNNAGHRHRRKHKNTNRTRKKRRR